MGQRYVGPRFEELQLPGGLRERIRSAAHVAETRTESLGISIEGKTYPKARAEIFWKFNGYNEVYQFRLGMLWEAYFRNGDTTYKLWIRGHKNLSEIAEVEKALGLQVVERPREFDKKADVRIGGQSLEIISLSSSQELKIRSKFDYMVPKLYLGRR